MRLSPHCEALLQEFHNQRPELQQLENKVFELLQTTLRHQGIELNSIEHRVKTEQSLAGKLELKGEKYRSLSDITDLVGLRIVTFYTDDVDKVAAIVSQLFDIDWNNSVDKRKLHQLTSFGYNSLHYICRLHEGSIPFEIQIRTALQHTWSAIEHDIGYKGAVKLPPEYRRQFSRLAGMLELADDEFSRLRTTMTEYRRQIQTLVKSGNLNEVTLSTDSFRSYLDLRPFDRLNQRIAAVNQAELFPASLMPFLPVLEHFGMESLGEVQAMVDELSDTAYQLALSQLAITDLDILSESVGLQNLCIVWTLKHGGNREEVKLIYDTIYGANDSNAYLADGIIHQYTAIGQS
ncbi:GTP pyrophosphokinase family protein [Prevotella sp. P6B1]|uniref:GTP pyrophosphokinase n=1 Tax=Prevotella sp. P6B1 TaxID=1410613 RepID=UPI00051C930E|nr:RelA/SpoT domain-containing protein [Prevotella sp. P6B1]